ILNTASQIQTSDYFKNIPLVEKNLLKSKLFAYDEWMKIYESTLKSRHEQYGQIKRSKEFIIDQTKKSLKPYITQYKLYEEALSSSSARKGLFSDYLISRGLAEPFIVYRIDYFIKSVTDMYQIMAPKQFTREDEMNGVFGKYGCYDKFMKEELIFNFDHGLICDFPWITEEWVEEKVQEITKSHYWNSDRTYFTFHKLKTQRAVAELPMGGGNIMNEDTDFTHTMFLMSRNVFVSKMLELKAKEEEVEHYVDKMLGIIPKVKGKKIIKYEKKRGTEYLVDGKVYDSKKKMIEVYSLDEYTLMEYKTPSKLIAQIKEILYINFKIRAIGGPYEHHFYKGINKTFFKGYVQARFNTICGMFLRRIDVEGKITPLEPRDGQKIFQTQIDSL
ncbi:MAG: hypothetical protein KAI55_03050, partial [Candidatus Aenigmarchaeota archaeon]|nr:hypothetical protein [Candidatus Aenigmarchaeota archaeon]